MIKLEDFYDDIGFMAALAYNCMLKNEHIYKFANHLNNKMPDANLDKIIANKPNDNSNKELLENYLNKLGINFLNFRRALIAKIFYYILHDRISFDEGIKFADHSVIISTHITKHVDGDINFGRILGDFIAIEDRDVRDRKNIEAFKKRILKNMRQYVKEHLEEFPVDKYIA